MTLIIVIAGLLIIAIIIIAIFGIATKRYEKKLFLNEKSENIIYENDFRKQNSSHYLNASNYNEPYQAYPDTLSNQNYFANLRLNLTQADNTTR